MPREPVAKPAAHHVPPTSSQPGGLPRPAARSQPRGSRGLRAHLGPRPPPPEAVAAFAWERMGKAAPAGSSGERQRLTFPPQPHPHLFQVGCGNNNNNNIYISHIWCCRVCTYTYEQMSVRNLGSQPDSPKREQVLNSDAVPNWGHRYRFSCIYLRALGLRVTETPISLPVLFSAAPMAGKYCSENCSAAPGYFL